MLNLDIKQKLWAQTVIATGKVHHFQLIFKFNQKPASAVSLNGVLQYWSQQPIIIE